MWFHTRLLVEEVAEEVELAQEVRIAEQLEKRLGNQTQQCQHCLQLFVRNREELYTVLDLIYLLSMKRTMILTLKLNKKHLKTSILHLNLGM